MTGKDGCGNATMLEVPIRYGSGDRVVEAIGTSHTTNKLFTLPTMACYLTGLEIAPDRLSGINATDRRQYMEQGGVFPTDIKSIKRVKAIPYNATMDLSIYASNSDQLYQMLEQILLLFDYDLQLQVNDAPFDWARVLRLELTGINNEEVYPSGTERRVLVYSFQFKYEIWLSPPVELRDDIIRSIMLRFGDLDNFVLNEIDENGDLAPFTDGGFSTTLILSTDPLGETVPELEPQPGGMPETGTSVLNRVSVKDE